VAWHNNGITITKYISMDSNETNNNKGNAIKDPDNWTTGNESMTEAQRSYLHTLADEANVEIDENMTKAEASKKIEELQKLTGRGLENQ
jgi:hypothetical protein